MKPAETVDQVTLSDGRIPFYKGEEDTALSVSRFARETEKWRGDFAA